MGELNKTVGKKKSTRK